MPGVASDTSPIMNLSPLLPEHPRIIHMVPGGLTAALFSPEGSGVFIFMKSAMAFGVREPVQKHDQAFKFHFFKSKCDGYQATRTLSKNVSMNMSANWTCPQTCPPICPPKMIKKRKY